MVITITDREYQLLIRLHKQRKEIAEEMGIVEGTVNKMYYRLSAKLDAKTRTELVLKALKYGLVELEEFKI